MILWIPSRPIASRPIRFPHQRASGKKTLEATGKEYYEFRAALDGQEQRGPDQNVQPLSQPRRTFTRYPRTPYLHAQMDRAVLDAYGWTDIQPIYEFREQLDEEHRLSWGEYVQDEVLSHDCWS